MRITIVGKRITFNYYNKVESNSDIGYGLNLPAKIKKGKKKRKKELRYYGNKCFKLFHTVCFFFRYL